MGSDVSTVGSDVSTVGSDVSTVGSDVSTVGSDVRAEEKAESLLDRVYRLFRRVTWSTRYLPVIDGLRFVAILSVVLYHVHSVMPRSLDGGRVIRPLLLMGNIGVQFFFAISGFILSVPFFQKSLQKGQSVSLRAYYLRRLIRLEPTYLINLLLLFALGFYPSWGNDLAHLGASVVYSHNWIYGMFSNINFVAWSLEIEIQFYLLMPLFAWLFIRGHKWVRRFILIVVCIPFVVWQHSKYGTHFPHGLSLLDQIQFFATGLILADVYVNDWGSSLDIRSWKYDLVAWVGWLSIPLVMWYALPYARYTIPFSLFLAYAGTLRSRFFRAFLSLRWIAVIGGMCYTIYLYHWFFFRMTLDYLGGFQYRSFWMNFLVTGSILVCSIFILSAIFYLLFEKPFMTMGRGLLGKKKETEV